MFLLVALLLSSKYSADGFGRPTATIRTWQQQPFRPFPRRHRGIRGLADILVLDAASAKLDVRSREQIMSDAIAATGLTQVKKKKKKAVAACTDSPGGANTNASRKKKNSTNNTRRKKAPKPSTSKQQSSHSLTSTKEISLQSQLSYSREGHTSLRALIPSSIIAEIYSDLQSYSQTHRKKGEDSAPFLQFYNTWRDLPSVRALAESPLLCSAACTLMGMRTSGAGSSQILPSLRLYQDSVFIKRKNKDGITPWHIDGRMMPFDTSNIITFWIPLHSIPAIEDGGTGLLFISKSHSDFSLPYWNGRGLENDETDGNDDDIEDSAYNNLTGRYGIDNVGDDRIVDNNPGVIGHHMPLSVGDCTVHNGWTMHCANGNIKNMAKKKKTKQDRAKSSFQTRYAIAISYVDSYAEVRADVPGVGKNVSRNCGGEKKKGSNNKNRVEYKGDAEDRASYAEWIGDVWPRTRFQHKLMPDVWPPSSSSSASS